MREIAGCFVLLLAVAAVGAILAAVVAHMRRSADHGSSGALGAAMLEVQSLLEPDKRHTIEEVRADKRGSDEIPGDLPEKVHDDDAPWNRNLR